MKKQNLNYTKSCTFKKTGIMDNKSRYLKPSTLKKELKEIIISNIDGDMRLDNIDWLLADLKQWIEENYTPKEFKQLSNPLDVCENCNSDTPAMTTNSECPYCHKKL